MLLSPTNMVCKYFARRGKIQQNEKYVDQPYMQLEELMREDWLVVPPERKLSALVRRINESCTVSESAQEVMNLTRAGKEISVTKVADAVMKDPALATEILKIANSPLFGQAKHVIDLKRAVVIVGMQELHNIAAAMSMMTAFATGDPLSKSLRDTAVLSAAVARFLAKRLDLDESEAFLSGLLSEIGAMACVAVDTTDYRQIWQEANGQFDIRALLEAKRYTASSEDIGYHLLIEKQLPEEVAEAIKQGVGEGADLLASVTVFSRRVSPLIVKAANESDATILHETIPALYDELGLPDIGTPSLIEICIEAAKLAELSLRGEASLVEEDPVESLGKKDPAVLDIEEIVYTETEERKTLTAEAVSIKKTAGVRMGESTATKTPTKWMVVAIVIVAVLALAVLYFLDK